MNLDIKSVLYDAILSNQWVEVEYKNLKNEITNYYIGIKDIDAKSGKLYCDIFNIFKGYDCIDEKEVKPISFSGIQKAKLVNHSYYETPKELFEKIDKDILLSKFLEVDKFDNDILRYLSDCYFLDNDPYLKDSVLIDGIDTHVLARDKKYKLDDDQFKKLVNVLFKKTIDESMRVYKKAELAINIFSIDIGNHQYIVAYRTLSLNFKDRYLVLGKETKINKSFLIEEDKKVTLSTYLDMSAEEFCETFDQNKKEYIDDISSNYRNGELTNTRPTIFLIERKSQRGVDKAFEAISLMESNKELTHPLKAFFGRIRANSGTSKEPNIVVFDKTKINIDQMRVVYNSMVNHVTYVKGPPGTGKTETIFNVLLSAYANEKKVLVCSNNNHPVDDIFAKMTKSLIRKDYKTQKEEQIIFPIFRLGNNVENIKAIRKLKEIYSYVVEHKDQVIRETSTEQSKQKFVSASSELRNLLKKYEERNELLEKIEKLEEMKSYSPASKILEQINRQIDVQQNKLTSSLEVKDSQVAELAVSAKENFNFINFLYYSSLSRLKKLLAPTNKDLKEIILTEDENIASLALNKYLSDDLNLKRFTDIFPIIVSTNLSCDKLGEAKPQFDLCIMDESGQCNIASSLIPIVRATDLLLVGDTNQLQPVTVIESDVNSHLMSKYNIKPEYDYVKNSILSTMLRKDNNSKSILLRFHYRCGKKIANFVNSRFYEEQLKLLNPDGGNLTYINVKNTKIPDNRNCYYEEAKAIVDLIKKNKYSDAAIITPFRNQAELLNNLLVKENIKDVKAGTVHTLQGSEKSVIIMSSAISLKTAKKTMSWIADNHELINVAVTRAKKSFVFAGDKEAIDLLSKDKITDLKALSDYVYNNGESIVPKSEVTIYTDFSNNSQNEKDFFATISPYFNRRFSKLRIERNMPVSKAIANIKESDLGLIGRKEFDVIVQAAEGISKYRTIVVFEVDGGEHVGSARTSVLDRQKEEICRRYGVKLIRIANSQVKDYELIIRLFECVIKDIPDIEEVYKQLSLFDDF